MNDFSHFLHNLVWPIPSVLSLSLSLISTVALSEQLVASFLPDRKELHYEGIMCIPQLVQLWTIHWWLQVNPVPGIGSVRLFIGLGADCPWLEVWVCICRFLFTSCLMEGYTMLEMLRNVCLPIFTGVFLTFYRGSLWRLLCGWITHNQNNMKPLKYELVTFQ